MDCCTINPDATGVELKDCPSCGLRGRRVKPITLSSLLRAGVDAPAKKYRFEDTRRRRVRRFVEPLSWGA